MIPIIIGVTGHRDLQTAEITSYKQKIKTVITDIKTQFPNTTIQVMSALAEGADMLVAEAAILIGCELIAVLPMPREKYILELNSNCINRFNELINNAVDIIELPITNTELENLTIQYEALGVYIVHHSQVLIGLWNGADNQKPGGTASVIKYALSGVPQKYRTNHKILDLDESKPIYHIEVNRLNENISQNIEIECLCNKHNDYNLLYSNIWIKEGIEKAREYYYSIYKKIDSYNIDSRKILQNSNNKIQQSKNYILPECEQKELLPEINEILDQYATADVLAQKFQKSTIRLLICLLCFGFLTFIWVGFYDEIYSQLSRSNLILLLVPLFFGLAYFTYRYTSNKDIENKYYDYRALAEGLRVQFYWKLIGIVDNSFDYYNRKLKGEIGWIIIAVSNISLRINEAIRDREIDENNHMLLYNCWLQDQLNYFEKSEKKISKAISKQKGRSTLLFIVGMIFVAMLFLSPYILGLEWVEHGLLFLIDFFFAVGTLFTGYLEKRQFESQYNQFIRMKQLYEMGTKECINALEKRDYNFAKEIIKEIGIEALTENGDWVVYNRANSLEIPME